MSEQNESLRFTVLYINKQVTLLYSDRFHNNDMKYNKLLSINDSFT